MHAPRLAPLRRAASTLASATGSSAAPERIYTARKSYLHDYYAHLLSASQMVLLFRHGNLTVSQSGAVRRAIAKVPLPPSASEQAVLTITRTGLLTPVARKTGAADLVEGLQGQTALLTCPTLSPKYIKTMLAAVEKAIKSVRNDEVKDESKQPLLTLLAGVVEGKVLQPEAVREIANLPEIEQLRGQLVGLLELPQRQMVGVLGQAGGGGLVRTLQGLEQTLKDKEGSS